jgi:hypothetical protein
MPRKTHISSMVCTYKLYLLNRHLFIDLPEGRALIDTGAPFSSSTSGRLTWQNQNHGVNKGGYMGFTFDKPRSTLCWVWTCSPRPPCSSTSPIAL